MGFVQGIDPGDDDVCHYIGERLKLEGETESMGVCTKERKGMTAEVQGLSALGLCQIDHRSDTDGDSFANHRCLCMDR